MPWKYEMVGFEDVPSLKECAREADTFWEGVLVCSIRLLWPLIKPVISVCFHLSLRPQLKKEVARYGEQPYVSAVYTDFDGNFCSRMNQEDLPYRGDWVLRAYWVDKRVSNEELDQTVEAFMDELVEIAKEQPLGER